MEMTVIMRMVLKKKTKITGSRTSYTQYVSIPSALVRDSQYPFKEGDEVEIRIERSGKIIIEKKREVGKK
jgi:antitoxin component of MazEF toxin-antitoxin module